MRVNYDQTTMVLIFHVGIKTTLFYLITYSKKINPREDEMFIKLSGAATSFLPTINPNTRTLLITGLQLQTCFRLCWTDDILFLCYLHFLDPSEQCRHTLDQQKHLFDSIRPLFLNKPLVVVSNKMDVTRRGEFTEEKEAIFKEIEKDIASCCCSTGWSTS